MPAGLVFALLLAAGPWGVRTLPDGDAGWVVRWEGGPAPVEIDGARRTVAPPLRLDAGRPHAVAVGPHRFTLPPAPDDPCAPLRFIALGDGRAAVDGVGPSAYWAPILAEAIARRPAFVVNTGDLVKNGERPDEWAAYLRTLPPWPPVVAVRGNHDRGPHFYRLGLAPGPVFAWTVGPLLLAGIDTEVPAIEPVAAALDGVLAASHAPWKIVVMHRPIWSRGNHGSDERGFNRILVPLFDRHDVALVLAGHDHDYERFCASVGVGPERRCAGPGRGTVYVVTGGAATFTNPVPGVARGVPDAVADADAAASRRFSGAHHVVEIEIRRGRLEGTVHRTRAGNVRPPGVMDRFVITRPDPEACQRRPDAGVGG